MDIPELLRQIMRRWPTGVAVITTGDIHRRHGMTVNSFASVSLEPPVVVVTLANKTRTKHLLDEIGFFCINLLSENQEEVSDRFAGKIDDADDRFEKLQIATGFYGVPILEEAAAYIECRVINTIELLNSTLFAGEVLTGEKTKEEMPLLYFNRGYHRIQR